LVIKNKFNNVNQKIKKRKKLLGREVVYRRAESLRHIDHLKLIHDIILIYLQMLKALKIGIEQIL
jgi:hypothetical protein